VLRGKKVLLRARVEDDVPILQRELHDDVAGYSRSDNRAWRPTAPGHSPYAVAKPRPETAPFTVVDLATDEVAGEASLWRIDLHNRSAHLGIALSAQHRGRGLGREAVDLLVRFGFRTLGLHRLQLETLADNAAMIAVAMAAGFRHEGTLVDAGWVNGEFLDEVVYGMLSPDHR
jgi:RimJ/RimL family protein N-acetyltransferase